MLKDSASHSQCLSLFHEIDASSLRKNIKAVRSSLREILCTIDTAPIDNLPIFPEVPTIQQKHFPSEFGGLFGSLANLHARLVSLLGSSLQLDGTLCRREEEETGSKRRRTRVKAAAVTALAGLPQEQRRRRQLQDTDRQQDLLPEGADHMPAGAQEAAAATCVQEATLPKASASASTCCRRSLN